MTKQVITIKPTGNLAGLVHKPGKGIDITKMGRAKVTRASDIIWSEDHQKWCIKALQGPQAGKVLTVGDLALDVTDEVAYFTSYEVAVENEIDYFNHLRATNQLVEMDEKL